MNARRLPGVLVTLAIVVPVASAACAHGHRDVTSMATASNTAREPSDTTSDRPPIQVGVGRFQVEPPDAPLRGEAVSEHLGSALVGLPGIVVVEVQQVDALLDELEWQARGFVADDELTPVGAQLPADWIVHGTATVLDGILRLTARVQSVRTGEIRASSGVSGPLASRFRLELELAQALRSELRRLTLP